jgi:hypothetical protein
MEAAMRQVLAVLAVVVTAGCGHETFRPTAPTTVASTTVASPLPPSGGRFTEIAAGELVRGRETADDPECVGLPGWRCQYFRFTAPRDGTLEVLLTYSARQQSLDISMWDHASGEWWHPIRTRVTAHITYDLTVWYTTPGQEFELRLSLE